MKYGAISKFAIYEPSVLLSFISELVLLPGNI